jgi:hypothetical protein
MTTDTLNVFLGGSKLLNVEAVANQQHIGSFTALHPTKLLHNSACFQVPRITELHHSNSTQLQEGTTHFCVKFSEGLLELDYDLLILSPSMFE